MCSALAFSHLESDDSLTIQGASLDMSLVVVANVRRDRSLAGGHS